jgi:hypothetical protein
MVRFGKKNSKRQRKSAQFERSSSNGSEMVAS